MSASAFTLTSNLTGDPRPDNPDNIFVKVKITSGESGYTDKQALWEITPDSPLHPEIKLLSFYFNLAESIKNDVSFSEFDPTGWTITSPANNASGSGGADFQFTSFAQAGTPKQDIGKGQTLKFLMDLNGGGTLSASDFTNALESDLFGSGESGPYAQLGAHVGGLGPNGEDSGFAYGNYNGTPIPEPASMLGIMAFGALGGGRLLRKKKRQAAQG